MFAGNVSGKPQIHPRLTWVPNVTYQTYYPSATWGVGWDSVRLLQQNRLANSWLQFKWHQWILGSTPGNISICFCQESFKHFQWIIFLQNWVFFKETCGHLHPWSWRPKGFTYPYQVFFVLKPRQSVSTVLWQDRNREFNLSRPNETFSISGAETHGANIQYTLVIGLAVMGNCLSSNIYQWGLHLRYNNILSHLKHCITAHTFMAGAAIVFCCRPQGAKHSII